MVAVIKTGSSIRRIFNYNENKVKEGVAECIAAINYPKDLPDLTLSNKLNRLLNQAALNENVKRNSVHISLNFDPSEKLKKDELEEIAMTYMTKIGFGKQPYLVYQHHDAGHPHIHIVTVKVRENGSRIETQNIGRNQSEKARKEIEKSFGLVRAEDSKQRQAYELKPVNVQKVQYGRTETKRAITHVLDTVLKNYKYASLPELNAILSQYNVIAERGSEISRIYKNNGLIYRIIDEKGNKVGVPIKASDFYNKPTLKFLEAAFQQNEIARQSYKSRVKNSIDLALLKSKILTVSDLVKALEKDGIHTVLRQNEAGLIYGLTFVDHHTKCVFNGSSLGKQYSAKAIQERCGDQTLGHQTTSKEKQGIQQDFPKELQHTSEHKTNPPLPLSNIQKLKEEVLKTPSEESILDTLLKQESNGDYVASPFKKKGRKRRKKRISKHL